MDNKLENEFLKFVKSNYPKNAEKIISAYFFAKSAHEGVYRKSGEPYIVHPLWVAKILIDNNMDYCTVMAGLLHDVVEDTSYTVADISKMYGETVAKLVDSVTKIDKKTLPHGNIEDISIQKLILSMGADLRVILIKLADRLHNMRTINFLSRERQIKIASETEELFIPIADRLGIRKIRSELQELVFKTLHEEEYQSIKARFDARLAAKKDELKKIERKLKHILDKNGIKGQVKSWPEHYYSIYKKVKSEGISKVYGLMLYKVIIEGDEIDCYKVLGMYHKAFRHLPAQIKDFITEPKPNGYRSLHTVLISDEGDVTFKVMIRTREMDDICEHGVSLMWSGKDGDEAFSSKIEKYNKLKEITVNENKNLRPTAFIDAIKSDLFSNVTWTFTPKLKPICLSSDRPTAVDFAYAVHTDIGHSASGAVINGKNMPLSTTLKAGDIVEILVSSKPKSPSRSWLKLAKTSSARQKINKYFADHFKPNYIAIGKKKLEAELKKTNHTLSDIEDVYEDIVDEYNFSNMDEIYASVGYESITTNQITSFVLEKEARENFLLNVPVEILGLSEFSGINYPKCCSAVPGDEIIALVKKGEVSIHRTICKEAKRIENATMMDAVWKKNVKGEFSSNIKILAADEVGFGAKLLMTLAKFKVNLNKTQARKVSEDCCEFEIGVQVKNLDELSRIIERLQALDGVKSVTRLVE